jgi:hypothetical protein
VWVRVLLLCYPLCTVFAITVTANHWLLDAVGGWIVLAASWTIVVLWERQWRRPQPDASPADPTPADAAPADQRLADQR